MKEFFVVLVAILACRIIWARSPATVPFAIDASEDVANQLACFDRWCDAGPYSCGNCFVYKIVSGAVRRRRPDEAVRWLFLSRDGSFLPGQLYRFRRPRRKKQLRSIADLFE